MSHEKIYNIIKNNNERKKYSLILEDDFNIISDKCKSFVLLPQRTVM